MGIEFYFYPKSATQKELQQHLFAHGFEPNKSIVIKKFPKESSYFFWFEENEFKSISGVEATIFPPTDEIKAVRGDCDWAIHTRTSISASSFDKEKQNEVIRSARKKFGGAFINDLYGKNRYTPIEKDKRGPIGRGIFASYNLVIRQLGDIKDTLPQPMIPPIPENEELSHLISRVDPSRVLYNALVPFSVAAIEHFFGKSFKILLHYDEEAQKRIREQTRKIEIADVLAISSGEKTIEDIIAGWYSFQNIQSISMAYKDWFGIDLWKILRQKRKIGRRITFLEKHFDNMIQFRHGVIHRFELNLDLKREDIISIIDTTIVLMESFMEYLETERNVKFQE